MTMQTQQTEGESEDEQPNLTKQPLDEEEQAAVKPAQTESDVDLDIENDWDNLEVTTIPDRNMLYKKGSKLYARGRHDLALKCLLKCITGLDETKAFTFLPQCLHNIADIYYEKGEYGKAIQFIQAEKMIYETALIDTSLLQTKVEVQQRAKDKDAIEEGQKPEVARRADEYETLARVCLENNQPHMALEYQGKATKLRQQVYGDHPVTAKSYDLFTAICGEVGKYQYSENLEKIQSDEGAEKADSSPHSGALADEPESEAASSPSSILRKKSSPSDPQKEYKRSTSRVRFQEPQPDSSVRRERQHEEEHFARILVMVFLLITSVILMFLLAYLYCKLEAHSPTCIQWKSDLHYYTMRLKYLYYHYTSSSKDG